MEFDLKFGSNGISSQLISGHATLFCLEAGGLHSGGKGLSATLVVFFTLYLRLNMFVQNQNRIKRIIILLLNEF